MRSTLSAYIPVDRLAALAMGQSLPEHVVGTVLFADISGFTPLTESLRQSLGQRRGAEELSGYLNRVYDVLIAEVERYGGSVMGFSGDAITCWFDTRGQSVATSAQRAAAAAIAMQNAMRQYENLVLPNGATTRLAVKVALASGPARRLVVGNPAIQLMDILVGKTIERMAIGETLALSGEILIDQSTATLLAGTIQITEQRIDTATHEVFYLLKSLNVDVAPMPWPSVASATLSTEIIHPWVLPAVVAHVEAGLGEFLTELRSVVALFLGFDGLDYEGDVEAGTKLDALIRWVQSVLDRHAGNLIQLTIGDKGSYLLAVFGAPIAHEDDAYRAVRAASQLSLPPSDLNVTVRIGISQGMTRTGAYGSATRRTYGTLGDEVNLAARLMQNTPAGTVIVSDRIRQQVSDTFEFRDLPALKVKGKAEPLSVAHVIGRKTDTASVRYGIPIIGREAELAQINAWMTPLLEGHFAGVMVVYGEAGIGKTRLVYELRQQYEVSASLNWFTAPVDEVLQQSLNPFEYLARIYFDQHPNRPIEVNTTHFHEVFEQLRAELIRIGGDRSAAVWAELERTRYFLEVLVGLHPTNLPLAQLDPRLRLENTLSAIKALLLTESLRRPLLLHIEDAHLLDPDSKKLLALLTRNVNAYPFGVLMTSRYSDDGSHPQLPLDAEVPHQRLDLIHLTAANVEQLVTLVLGGVVGAALIRFITEKTNGNPFFVEQIALDLMERNLLLQQDGQWMLRPGAEMEVPDEINAVLVARLDRLALQVKAVVQTAAVLGQEFEVQVLVQMLRDIYRADAIQEAEQAGIWLALTQLRYLFRHALLRDAAYSMQMQARLRELHQLAANAMETLYAAELSPYYGELAYHFQKANLPTQERYYARLAGERAETQYANTDALTFLNRALDLTPDDEMETQYALLLLCAKIYGRIGASSERQQALEKLEVLTARLNDLTKQAEVSLERADFLLTLGDFPGSHAAFQTTIRLSQASNEHRLNTAAHVQEAFVLFREGEYDAAFAQAGAGLQLAQQSSDQVREIQALAYLGIITGRQGNPAGAQAYLERGFELAHQINHLKFISGLSNNLGIVLMEAGDYEQARRYFEQALVICKQSGDKNVMAAALANLAGIADHLGDFAGERVYHEQALALFQEIGSQSNIANVLGNMGLLYLKTGDRKSARSLIEEAITIQRQLGMKQNIAWCLNALGMVSDAENDHSAARHYYLESLALRRELGEKLLIINTLRNLTRTYLAVGERDTAIAALDEGFKLSQEVGTPTAFLDLLTPVADWYWRDGRMSRAAELLGLQLAHPAYSRDYNEENEALRQQLEVGLGLEELTAAMDRGKGFELETVINEIQADLEVQ